MRDPIRCTLSPHLRLPTVTQRQWVKNVSRNEQGLLAEVKQCPAVSNSISLSLFLSLSLSIYLSIYLSLFLSLSSSCIRSRFGFLFPFSVTVLTFSASCLFSLTPRLRNSIKSTETMISTRVARKSSSSKNREPVGDGKVDKGARLDGFWYFLSAQWWSYSNLFPFASNAISSG